MRFLLVDTLVLCVLSLACLQLPSDRLLLLLMPNYFYLNYSFAAPPNIYPQKNLLCPRASHHQVSVKAPHVGQVLIKLLARCQVLNCSCVLLQRQHKVGPRRGCKQLTQAGAQDHYHVTRYEWAIGLWRGHWWFDMLLVLGVVLLGGLDEGGSVRREAFTVG